MWFINTGLMEMRISALDVADDKDLGALLRVELKMEALIWIRRLRSYGFAWTFFVSCRGDDGWLPGFVFT